jgi:predicted Zn-dependent peptidase
MTKRIGRIYVLILASIFIFAFSASSELLPKSDEFTLDNGLRVIIIEDHRLPLVNMNLIFKTGSSSDSLEVSGLAAVTANMISKGSEKYPGTVLLQTIDSTGADFETDITRFGTTITANFLSRDLKLVLDVVADMVIRPELKQESMELIKNILIAETIRSENEIYSKLIGMTYRIAFGDHGSGLPILGIAKSLENINLADILKFQSLYYRPDNAVLIIAGDIETRQIKKLANRLFSMWTPGNEFPKPAVDTSKTGNFGIVIIDNPLAGNSEFIMAQPVTNLSGDYIGALNILDYILSSGKSVSRLHRRLINDLRLVTELNGITGWTTHQGLIGFHAAAINELAADAIIESLIAIKELNELKIPIKELDEARNFFDGFTPTLFESPSHTINQMRWFILNDLPFNFYEQLLKSQKELQPEQMRNLARQFLNPDDLIIIVNGPARILKPKLAEFGSVRVIKSERQ